MELRYKVQNYAWGKVGKESMVAQLLQGSDPEAVIENDKPYAELWLGTHPNGPSLLPDRDQLLSDYIKDNVDAIGPEVRTRFGVQIPFLLKVLSIKTALSIQAHPDKELARQLHLENPDTYKDPNHKPELAIALTPFEALCAFRPHEEIRQFIKTIPELRTLLSQDHVTKYLDTSDEYESMEALQGVFQSLMESQPERVAQALERFQTRLQTEDAATQEKCVWSLVRSLCGQFPGDVGCACAWFLNHARLRPGEAVFLPPGLPHAYLSGDCIEVQACSDNVIRAGLTPKQRAVGVLVRMLRYEPRRLPRLLARPEREDARCSVWRPPVADFAVARIKVAAGERYNTRIRAGPSLLLVVAGAGTATDTEPVQVRAGSALFLKASRQLALAAAGGAPLELFQAMAGL